MKDIFGFGGRATFFLCQEKETRCYIIYTTITASEPLAELVGGFSSFPQILSEF